MDGNSRPAMTGFLAVCLACGWAFPSANGQDPASPADAAQAREEYQRWVEQNSRKLLEGLKLAITAIEGDDKTDELVESPFATSLFAYGCTVSVGGDVSHFSISNRGRKGSSGTSIAPDDLKRLDDALANLPDDKSRLPAAGRRVIIQAAGTENATIRVYDRANAPAEILEILRLSQSHLRAWLPELKPQSKIDARTVQHGGFLCLSPDGARIIFTSMHGPLQFWEPTTHEPLGEIHPNKGMPLDAIAFHPNESFAVLSGGGKCEIVDTINWRPIRSFTEPDVNGQRKALSAPRFTPDGRRLVIQSNEPSLRIFDTATWERIARLPDVPEDVVRYIPAPTKKLAIIQTNDGVISLWNLDRNESVADLDKGCSVSEAVFAPDESLFAVVTYVAWNEVRLRLWKADSGEFVRELRPFELNNCEKVEHLFWSVGGRYLLATTKPRSFFTSEGISVWNATTGRHRGEFIGCPSDVIGVALLPDGSQLVAGCTDGKIRFWDFPAAMKQIGDFEESLQSHEPKGLR